MTCAPADGHTACRADVRAEPVEEHDLAVEQDDGHLRPVLGVRGPSAALLGFVCIRDFVVGHEDVVAALADSLAGWSHGHEDPDS
jgi:hypothetical protein